MVCHFSFSRPSPLVFLGDFSTVLCVNRVDWFVKFSGAEHFLLLLNCQGLKSISLDGYCCPPPVNEAKLLSFVSFVVEFV